jgi:hypothetical protein
MSSHGLGPPRTVRLIAAVHLVAAGVLLLGPLATTRALARVSRFPTLPFPLQAGRDGAAGVLLVVLLWIVARTWVRRRAGELRIGFRDASKASVLAVVCSLATAAAIVSGVLFRWPLWAFGAWLAALGVRIGRGRPAYSQSLAMQRLMLILGLFLVWWGFGALLAAQQVDVLMAPALGFLAITFGVLLLAIAAPMLVFLEIAAVRSALSLNVKGNL